MRPWPRRHDLVGPLDVTIDAFPERFHHPNEDKYLFRALRTRHPDAHSLLDRLVEEHQAGAHKIRALEQALARYQQGGTKEFSAFALAVESYSAFHWSHMHAEEMEVLPLARKYLTPEDWEVIDQAFLGHSDPLSGVDERVEFETLFTRICNLAPPPIGVGPMPR